MSKSPLSKKPPNRNARRQISLENNGLGIYIFQQVLFSSIQLDCRISLACPRTSFIQESTTYAVPHCTINSS
ncbi:uncharacterized protein ARMOST_15134 [Armillaria ostoyae]|uniref:Uncharacterized protein n=1 Tax=Armillaria ostoyae TaxID=47428 RepID=A0A284RSJ7_ARMOS|nr:uncharacterized protein ARMOST_15134 [Armillaria ostoyae]